FFVTDPPTPQIYTLSLHDALPISQRAREPLGHAAQVGRQLRRLGDIAAQEDDVGGRSAQMIFQQRQRRRLEKVQMDVRHPNDARSEEHTSELQSLAYLVCRLLLEK